MAQLLLPKGDDVAETNRASPETCGRNHCSIMFAAVATLMFISAIYSLRLRAGEGTEIVSQLRSSRNGTSLVSLAEETTSEETTCARMAGTYRDDQNHVDIVVIQNKCRIRFTYQGEEMTGKVIGHIVKVDGWFWAPGNITDDGLVYFNDPLNPFRQNGQWNKLCADIAGAYTDTDGKPFSVVQTGCYIQIEADDWISSLANKEAQSGEVIANMVRLHDVHGMAKFGTVKMNGTVEFPDGKVWLTGWCEVLTGGMCMSGPCLPERHAVCSHKIWCICPTHSCSDAKGICTDAKDALRKAIFPYPSFFRREMHYAWHCTYALVLARIQVLLMGVGCKMFCCLRFDMHWVDKAIKAFNLFLTVIFVHGMQPVVFVLVMYAYFPLMDAGQLLACVPMVLRELVYLLNIFMGMIFTPDFFLLTALSKSRVIMTTFYVFCPHYNIALELRVLSKAYAYFVIGLSICADSCAVLAMLIGIGGFNAMSRMWPTLVVLYCWTFVSVPVSVATWFLERRRETAPLATPPTTSLTTPLMVPQVDVKQSSTASMPRAQSFSG